MDHSTDKALVDRALAGDERALEAIVDAVYPVLTRLASRVVRNAALAEEAVQDALETMIDHLSTFEGRSTLATWGCRILVNGATKKLAREARFRPFSSFGGDGDGDSSVDPARLSGHGFWSVPPSATTDRVTPEDLALRREVRELLAVEVDALPEAQRLVVTLRDVEGWDSLEVCNALGITEVHQRVLLHRARAALRSALETYLGGAR